MDNFAFTDSITWSKLSFPLHFCMMASLKFPFPVPFSFLLLYTSLNIYLQQNLALILLQCSYWTSFLLFKVFTFLSVIFTVCLPFFLVSVTPQVLYIHKVFILDLVSFFFLITVRSRTKLTLITSSSCFKYYTKISSCSLFWNISYM